MKWKIFINLSLLLGILFSFSIYSHLNVALKKREQIKEAQEAVQVREAKIVAEAANSAWNKMAKLRSLEDEENFLKNDVPKLSSEEQRTIANIVRAKIFEMRFRKSEQLLARAKNLLEQDNYHPVGNSYIESARKIYRDNGELISAIKEFSSDPDQNARLEYLKGVYYYRSLLFMDIKEDSDKIKDLIEQSFKSFTAALKYKPKDWDAQVAIEVLQKNTKDLLEASAGEQGKQEKIRLRLLPGKDKEIRGLIGGPNDQEQGRY